MPDLLTGRIAEVPVTPDAPEAHEWAVDELSRRMYDTSPGLLSRVLDSIGDALRSLLEGITSGGSSVSPSLLPFVVVGAILAVVVIALVLAGPVRTRMRPQVPTASGVLFEDERGSRDLRAAADEAARAGDYSLAVIERFRAIVRALDERALIEDRPGLTAHEAAGLGSRAVPGLADELTWGARLFDAVRYGDTTAAHDDDERLRALDDAVQRVRRPAGQESVEAGAAELPPSLHGVLG
ncbi:DUF4129 domain-containing protein [Georgenia sp. Z1344]|uniref:DUF4129 domain-containing protein n=1 Tax=Georgenia sp. Z1344 TaxID=3416706 RepID=UPI003CF3ADC3